MKYLFTILILAVFAACHTEDPLEETSASAVCALAENADPAPTLARTADGDPVSTVGQRLTNPFSLTNMQQVLIGIQARNPILLPQKINPGVLAELQFLRFQEVKASHYHVKITPTSEEQFNLLKADTTLHLYSYPLNCELEGEGVFPFESAESDLSDLEGAPKDPLQPLYASIPVGKTLPADISYTVLENLYIPDELDEATATRSGTVFVSEAAAELWIEQSMLLTGHITVEEFNESFARGRSKWQPSGTIRAYDHVIKDYVPVPHAKVQTRRWFTTRSTYTDKNGYFQIAHWYKRPVNYSIAWESNKWDIRDGRVVQAFYNGPKRKGEWNLNIDGGKSLRYATITRALSDHFFKDLGPADRIEMGRHVKIGYRHVSSSRYGKFNHFVVSGVSLDIVIFGATNGKWNPTDQILSTTFHELGHCAMFHKAGGKSRYESYAENVRESWAKLHQWILTKGHYRALGHEIFEYIPYTYPERIVVHSVLFEKPHKYNLQEMTLKRYQENAQWQKYTPIFIDLVDDSNQKEYIRIFGEEKEKEGVYPDDNVCIKNYITLQRIVYASKTFAQLKQNLLNESANVAPSQDIIDYFSFYGL